MNGKNNIGNGESSIGNDQISIEKYKNSIIIQNELLICDKFLSKKTLLFLNGGSNPQFPSPIQDPTHRACKASRDSDSFKNG